MGIVGRKAKYRINKIREMEVEVVDSYHGIHGYKLIVLGEGKLHQVSLDDLVFESEKVPVKLPADELREGLFSSLTEEQLALVDTAIDDILTKVLEVKHKFNLEYCGGYIQHQDNVVLKKIGDTLAKMGYVVKIHVNYNIQYMDISW